MPQHGEYRAGVGFYDSTIKGWVKDPAKLPEVIGDRTKLPTSVPDWVSGKARSFKENPQMERLIQLRDSDKADDRAKYEAVAKGNLRMAVGNYEQAKTAAAE
ncbi:hypothetical protein [Microbacterium oleivorans]|uniref:Uncharacterized protein n=1 Tax=Microbacterium oleivorans TaxID=273677 RepID=A0A7D5IYN8_9MICO|nr:hypothetical protein [Microbacterium oleivorans]QLD11375.1 hypothetical protein HW566_06055 [Microbacterium oleivorans]